MDKDAQIFSNKSLSDVFNEIYKNTKKKERQINTLIAELKPLIKNVNDAHILVPLVKEYLEIGVKNDEHIVKMAAIIQRLINSVNKDDPKENIPSDLDDLLTEEEKKEILDQAKQSEKEFESLKDEPSDQKQE